jgi:hypothetical protein
VVEELKVSVLDIRVGSKHLALSQTQRVRG